MRPLMSSSSSAYPAGGPAGVTGTSAAGGTAFGVRGFFGVGFFFPTAHPRFALVPSLVAAPLMGPRPSQLESPTGLLRSGREPVLGHLSASSFFTSSSSMPVWPLRLAIFPSLPATKMWGGARMP